jgi:hypothetical protein
MLMLTCAGSVGTFPALGGFTFFAAGSLGVGWYWQLSPRPAGGLNGGSVPTPTGRADVGCSDEGEVGEDDAEPVPFVAGFRPPNCLSNTLNA